MDAANPLDATHIEALNRVLESAPVTHDFLQKCAHCFEPNAALSDHIQTLITDNAGQQEMARRIRQTFGGQQHQYQ